MDMRPLVPFRGQSALMRPDFGLFGSLQREVDRLFDDFARSSVSSNGAGMLMPSIDVSETDKEIEVVAELPGLERKDVDISLENDVLTIRGEKKVESKADDKDDKEKAKAYHVAERTYGVFYRVIQLPPGIDPSKVQATMSKGVLKVTIPKPAPSAAAKIEVKEAA
ncbi:MAG: Hsp20/alpha crystallin family protein [Xanthobacteraceae bacterium]